MMSIFSRYPILRAMFQYGTIWPSASITQDYLYHRGQVNWAKARRFSTFGCLFMAPVSYMWVAFSKKKFRGRTARIAITRALVEQLTFSPLGLVYFFIGMSLLEGKSWGESVEECRKKFWNVYLGAVVYWATVQSFNFYYVSQKRTILFMCMASFFWMILMAHVDDEQLSNK